MFTLAIIFWFGAQSPLPSQNYLVHYETAAQCIAARDWWLSHRDAEPPGWDPALRVQGYYADCFDKDWNFVPRVPEPPRVG